MIYRNRGLLPVFSRTSVLGGVGHREGPKGGGDVTVDALAATKIGVVAVQEASPASTGDSSVVGTAVRQPEAHAALSQSQN